MNPPKPTADGDATLLHKCLTKATTSEGDAVRYSHNWAFARRAMLQIWSDRLVCGDWTIPYASITEAVLVTVRQAFRPCHILRIRTAERGYQFGLSATDFWAGELPFQVSREKGRLGYSAFSIAIRAVIVGFLIYHTWKLFHQ